RSGNGVSVEKATITRARMEEILINAIEADRKRGGVNSTHTLGEPVAWIQRSYLNLIRESNVALHNVVVRGSILDGDGDVVPLFTAPQPAEPVKGQTGKTVLQSNQSLNEPVKMPSDAEDDIVDLLAEYAD